MLWKCQLSEGRRQPCVCSLQQGSQKETSKRLYFTAAGSEGKFTLVNYLRKGMTNTSPSAEVFSNPHQPCALLQYEYSAGRRATAARLLSGWCVSRPVQSGESPLRAAVWRMFTGCQEPNVAQRWTGNESCRGHGGYGGKRGRKSKDRTHQWASKHPNKEHASAIPKRHWLQLLTKLITRTRFN